MKCSEIAIDILKQYLKIDNNEEDIILNLILSSAIAHIKSGTGLTLEQIDLHEDLTFALLVLCNDMFTNRDYIINLDKVNPIVDRILNMHRVNFL